MSKTGRCSVCDRYKRLSERGLIRLHRAHGSVCDGTARPPKEPTPRPVSEWTAARKATLERDGHACQKCQATDDLEVHHRKERVFGGGHDLGNLITLCGNCHAEWTFCEPTPMSFVQWLLVPPARYLSAVFAREWPKDQSAAQFKRDVIALLRLARELHEAGK